MNLGTPLAQVLEAIILEVEADIPGIACSIYLLDQETKWLTLAAAPSLPPAYRASVSQAPIGPDVGSCPVAAYRNERVIVEDIQTDPRWAPIRHLVEGTDLRACWSQPIRDPNGRVLGTFAVYRSCTGGPSADDLSFMESASELASLAINRVRAEEELSAARDTAEDAMQRYRFIADNARDMIIRSSLDAHLTYVSPGSFRVLGYTPEEMAGLRPSDTTHPDDLPQIEAAIREMIDRRTPNLAEPLRYRCRHKNGRQLWIEANPTLVFDAHGEPIEIVDIHRDITESKLAQEALDATQREAQTTAMRLKIALDAASAGVYETDFEAGTFWCSPEFTNIIGRQLTFEEASDVWPNIHPDDAKVVRASITDSQAARGDAHAEWRVFLPDGRTRWVELYGLPTYGEDGNVPLKLNGVALDIDERKRQELALVEARRAAEAAAAAKAAFLANMSHELRTPLTSIIGFSRILHERQDLPGDVLGHARRIFDASETLLAIINDVLDLSKLDAGQADLERDAFSIEQVVDDLKGLLNVQAAEKNITLEAALDPNLPPLVYGDVTRLRQVMLNLIGNAVKFTSHGGVTIGVRHDAGSNLLRVEVRDTGPGISADALSRLFERFSQGEVSINRTHGGTGLGLAISRKIVTLMGGEIGVDSREGQGSTFWFEIPAPPADCRAEAAPASATAVECPTLRLLVVDDTAMNRELVRLMLEPLGLVIEEATGGSEAIQAAINTPFDLILMDVRMPGVDGLEASRAIRDTGGVNARTPILAVTADVQPENYAACHEAGMNDVVPKPITPSVLISKIVQWASGGPEASGQSPAANGASRP
jgi:PAS domain S-box-containing protein